MRQIQAVSCSAFLARLRAASNTLDVIERRRRVVRLVIEEVLVVRYA